MDRLSAWLLEGLRRRGWRLLACGLCAAAVAAAYQSRWVCDDAFISFRYAQHLNAGLGLVFNAGERVEGYTNFLWTVMIAMGMHLGFDPVPFSQYLGLLAFVGVLTVLFFFPFANSVANDATTGTPTQSLISGSPGGHSSSFFPMAACGFAAHFHARVFATGGLETMLFTLLVLSGLTLIWSALLHRHAHRWQAGTGQAGNTMAGSSRAEWRLVFGFVCLSLAALTRPEGIVFYPGALLAVVLSNQPGVLSWRSLFRDRFLWRAQAIFFAILLPFFFWRLFYYGYPLPNTYYAKSGGGANYSQGLYYLCYYAAAYYVLWLLPLLALLVGTLWRWWQSAQPGGGATSKKMVGALAETAPKPTDLPRSEEAAESWAGFGIASVVWLLFALPVLVLLFYYVRVGGDFMFARFLIPLTPFAYLLLESMARRYRRFWARALFAVAVVVLTLGYWNPFYGQPIPRVHGISQEHEIYRPAVVRAAGRVARSWQSTFYQAQVRVAIVGAQAWLAYYSQAPVVIEAAGGLTDRHIAHQPLARRGPVMGHEKSATLGYLQKRRVHLIMDGAFFPNTPTYARARQPFGTATIVCYDARVMEALRALPGFEIPRFELFLDDYIARMHTFSDQRVARDLSAFETFYFAHTPDERRHSLLRQRLHGFGTGR